MGPCSGRQGGAQPRRRHGQRGGCCAVVVRAAWRTLGTPFQGCKLSGSPAPAGVAHRQPAQLCGVDVVCRRIGAVQLGGEDAGGGGRQRARQPPADTRAQVRQGQGRAGQAAAHPGRNRRVGCTARDDASCATLLAGMGRTNQRPCPSTRQRHPRLHQLPTAHPAGLTPALPAAPACGAPPAGHAGCQQTGGHAGGAPGRAAGCSRQVQASGGELATTGTHGGQGKKLPRATCSAEARRHGGASE